MPSVKLIADSGSTNTGWCLIKGSRNKIFSTQGMSPYFINAAQMQDILLSELTPHLMGVTVNEVFYYGTGCSNPNNVQQVENALKSVLPAAKINVDHDLSAAAKAVCGREKGLACILGTGSNSCYYNGKKIIRNSPGLGYILGDEGSGAYLGKKVLQHYLYDIFDGDLISRFDAQFSTSRVEILNAVYKQPLPNRYLASYALFLAGNRGHYMIENIIEDGLNDFFIHHILRYPESRKFPVHFVGSIAFGFKDVLESLCDNYRLTLGKVLKDSLRGLIEYHCN